MKRILAFLSSAKTSLVLLLLFTVSIAVATFVEDKYDTNTANRLIYKAHWFELIILLMAVNFLGNLRRYHFFSPGKLGGFIFHVGFLVMILGAAITRYFGFEGIMHIREGESSNIIYSSHPYLRVDVMSTRGNFSASYPLVLSSLVSNNFHHTVAVGNKKTITVQYAGFAKNAQEEVIENAAGGEDMLALKFSSNGTSQGLYLRKGENYEIRGSLLAFGDTSLDNDIILFEQGGKIFAKTKEPLFSVNMQTNVTDTIKGGTITGIMEKTLFQYKNVLFTLVKYYRQAVLDFKSMPATDNESQQGIDVLKVKVGYAGMEKMVNLTENSMGDDPGQTVDFGGIKVVLKYGAKPIQLPFSLKLNDFILDRYAGSMSPSSFASVVTVNDPKENKNFHSRIYMNHVLDYQGYRFFQSSYDGDEQGTVLSVNHDFWGTWISYFSYLILMIGFIITMFARNSRFHFLSNALKNIRERRKTILLTPIFLLGYLGLQAQTNENHSVSIKEAEQFGKLLVQTYEGRLEPIHTLAYDVMHKISRKDEFDFEGRGAMDAMQVFVDMILDPEYWKYQKIILVRENSVANLLDIEDKYASFADFFDATNNYKLAGLVEKAFRKNPSQQNRFDKELIKVDERLNLFYMVQQGTLLKIFPENNASRKWVDWSDTIARRPITGTMLLINQDLQLNELSLSTLLGAYFQELMSASHSGNFSQAHKILGYLNNIQRNNIDAGKFPDEKKIAMEIRYNKSKIFKSLIGYYGIISLLILIFSFMENLKPGRFRWLFWAQWVSVILLMATFAYHSYGLILRWYLSGHAPWSDGYEALLFIAWSAVFAGLFFLRSTKIIQAATAFLACIALMTASHSNYDPQLTNLQPVLKSYWLVIHVAVITISYGFLGLGFILGTINMFLYIFKPKRNGQRANLVIHELTFINEKNLQIGLFLATLGTFLGGVWASESWGRYWGWDAKETWALIIIIVYSIVLHLRLVPKLRGAFIFNVSSIIGFASVLMTFIGVNYYFSKGLHSYASDDKTIFPIWGWLMIGGFIALITIAGLRHRSSHLQHDGQTL